MNAPPGLVESLLAGNRRSLARAITALENDGDAAATVRAALAAHVGRAHVVGVTGPPGGGKSTLVSALIGQLRSRGRTVAVVAVDPSSPITGGAVLGDRIRMAAHQADEGVFIRSLASRGHLGGLARSAADVVDALDAANFDIIIVETVGAGQSEVEITHIADTRLVVCPPGLGADVQAIKAGVLEIADAFVVSKADLPDAQRTERELLSMLALRRDGARPPCCARWPPAKAWPSCATGSSGAGARHALRRVGRRPGRPPVDPPRDGGRRLQPSHGLEVTTGGAAVPRCACASVPSTSTSMAAATDDLLLADMRSAACNSHGTIAALVDGGHQHLRRSDRRRMAGRAASEVSRRASWPSTASTCVAPPTASTWPACRERST